MGFLNDNLAAFWPGLKVPYVADLTVNNADTTAVDSAIKAWPELTFVLRNAARDTFYLKFKPDPGSTCNSQTIGRTFGETLITCGNAGSLLHEIGHAAGMYHEHERDDRPEQKNPALKTYPKHGGIKATPYDTGSVMHYPVANLSSGQRNAPSDSDRKTLLSTMTVWILQGSQVFQAATASNVVSALGDAWVRRLPLTNVSSGYVGPMAGWGPYLYLFKADRLYRVETYDGREEAVGNANWSGATSILEFRDQLYITQNDTLHRVDPVSGAWTALGRRDWAGPVFMASLKNFLFVAQNKRLHSVNPLNGQWNVIGPELGNVRALAAAGDWLYAVIGDGLFRVHPLTGAIAALGSSSWPGAVAMGGWRDRLFIVQGGSLHSVEVPSGARTPIGKAASLSNAGALVTFG